MKEITAEQLLKAQLSVFRPIIEFLGFIILLIGMIAIVKALLVDIPEGQPAGGELFTGFLSIIIGPIPFIMINGSLKSAHISKAESNALKETGIDCVKIILVFIVAFVAIFLARKAIRHKREYVSMMHNFSYIKA